MAHRMRKVSGRDFVTRVKHRTARKSTVLLDLYRRTATPLWGDDSISMRIWSKQGGWKDSNQIKVQRGMQSSLPSGRFVRRTSYLMVQEKKNGQFWVK